MSSNRLTAQIVAVMGDGVRRIYILGVFNTLTYLFDIDASCGDKRIVENIRAWCKTRGFGQVRIKWWSGREYRLFVQGKAAAEGM